MERMKQYTVKYILVLMAATMIYSCSIPEITGEGAYVVKPYELEEIKGISINIPAKVILTQSNNQSITIKAQQNILDAMVVERDGDALDVSIPRARATYDTLLIFLNIQDLTIIDINGSAKVVTSGKFAAKDVVEIEANGASKVIMDLYANTIKTAVNGAAKVLLTGNFTDQYIDINGAGVYRALEAKSENAEIEINGAGECEINATNSIDVSINGAGKLIYKKYPNLSIDQEVNGAGIIEVIE